MLFFSPLPLAVFLCTLLPTLNAGCVDWPEGWVDSVGIGCEVYEIPDRCDDEHVLPFAVNFQSAYDVCCACGGGRDTDSQVPKSDPKLTTAKKGLGSIIIQDSIQQTTTDVAPINARSSGTRKPIVRPMSQLHKVKEGLMIIANQDPTTPTSQDSEGRPSDVRSKTLAHANRRSGPDSEAASLPVGDGLRMTKVLSLGASAACLLLLSAALFIWRQFMQMPQHLEALSVNVLI